MASLRLAGASPVTSRPSMLMVPPLVSSSPAISRSSVDLPQPDGPTKTTNSPFSITRSRPGMMDVDPKDLETFLSVMFPMVFLPEGYCPTSVACGVLFHGTKGQAAHQLLLAEPAHDQDGCDRQRRGRRKLGPEQALRAGERTDEGGERSRIRGGQDPHQYVLGPLGRRESHRPCCRYGDQQGQDGRADRQQHRVQEELEIAALRLNLGIALERSRRDQVEALDRLLFRLERGDDR